MKESSGNTRPKSHIQSLVDDFNEKHKDSLMSPEERDAFFKEKGIFIGGAEVTFEKRSADIDNLKEARRKPHKRSR